ncbi:MAG: aminodeoxychorismate lyase [Calditrichia bacterium]
MIYWNGQLYNYLPFYSSVVTRGEALFETMLFESGIIWFKERHISRLIRSCGQLNFQVKPAIDLDSLVHILNSGNIERARIKLILLNDPDLSIPYYFEIYPLALSNENNPISLCSMFHPISDKAFRSCKTINYGSYFYLNSLAQKRGFSEVLFTDRDNYLLETSIANIFGIRNNTLYTPTLSLGLLPGIIREIFLEIFPVKEVEIHLEEIEQFDYFITTNSIREIRLVTRINDVYFKPDNTDWISKTFEQYKQTYFKEHHQ